MFRPIPSALMHSHSHSATCGCLVSHTHTIRNACRIFQVAHFSLPSAYLMRKMSHGHNRVIINPRWLMHVNVKNITLFSCCCCYCCNFHCPFDLNERMLCVSVCVCIFFSLFMFFVVILLLVLCCFGWCPCASFIIQYIIYYNNVNNSIRVAYFVRRLCQWAPVNISFCHFSFYGLYLNGLMWTTTTPFIIIR